VAGEKKKRRKSFSVRVILWTISKASLVCLIVASLC